MITALVLFLAVGLAEGDPVHIRAMPDGRAVEVAAVVPPGVRDRLAEGPVAAEVGERWLRLTTWDEAARREGPAILGRYECRDAVLAFRPRLALAPGQVYRASCTWPGRAAATVVHREPERQAAPATRVERVYPGASVLPANHLKFYLHFSRPMRESREVFDHLDILDASGKAISDPWRRTELWSPDGKRLTLWIHPGRVKQGVNLREQLGPVLEAGQVYTLRIGRGLLDAEGRPLAGEFTKHFRTTADDRTCPDPAQWQVRVPIAGSTGALAVEFPEPLDRALVERCLEVRDESGQAVAGRVEVGPEERRWSFQPVQPWQEARYTLRVDERLEDLAGNTPLRPFEVDLGAPPPGRGIRLERSFRPTRAR